MKQLSYYAGKALVVFLAISLIMAGCGGGGGGSGSGENAQTVTTVTGVTAVGAPLAGTVILKDSSITTRQLSTSSASDGSYSFDVSGLTPPFLLRATGTAGGNNYTLYSLTASVGNCNINPLTHLAVTMANSGQDPAGTFATPTPTKIESLAKALPAAVANIHDELTPLFNQIGASTVNVVTDQIAANGQGVDLLFDLVSITVNNGTVSMVNKADGATILPSTSIAGGILSDSPNAGVMSSVFTITGHAGGVSAQSKAPPYPATPLITAPIDAQGNYKLLLTNGTYEVCGSGSSVSYCINLRVNNANVTDLDFIQSLKAPQKVVYGLPEKGTLDIHALQLVGNVTTLAGSASGESKEFERPYAITTDGTNLYLTDNYAVRRVNSSTGLVTTLAGQKGAPGFVDGTGAEARFYSPSGITTDGKNLYIVDNNSIRKVDISTGAVVTLIDNFGEQGSCILLETAIPPRAITTDGTNLYVTDYQSIRKVVISTGEISTLAGKAGAAASLDGIGAEARFYLPSGIASDGQNLYVMDNFAIRKIVVSTGAVTTLAGKAGMSGYADGPGTEARFYNFASSAAITTDRTDLYVTDDEVIRKVSIATGIVSTVAGKKRREGFVDGIGAAASFFWPTGITTDGVILYVVDSNGLSIRKIVISTGAVTTLAGRRYIDGVGSAARFVSPQDITTDGSSVFVVDYNSIRKVDILTGLVAPFAGAGSVQTYADGIGSEARFWAASGITTDGKNLYVSDRTAIRKVNISTGAVSTLAGIGTFGYVDATGSDARFSGALGITTDGVYLYVIDNFAIRYIVIATGEVRTLAGNPNTPASAEGTGGSVDGTGSAARFKIGSGITTDGTNLYVLDNSTIRKIVIATGVVTTLAGKKNTYGYADGIGSEARFYQLWGITTDGINLYVSDDTMIRKVDIATGTVTTLAGQKGLTGDTDGASTEARFTGPGRLTTDGVSLYKTDGGAIRKIR